MSLRRRGSDRRGSAGRPASKEDEVEGRGVGDAGGREEPEGRCIQCPQKGRLMKTLPTESQTNSDNCKRHGELNGWKTLPVAVH